MSNFENLLDALLNGEEISDTYNPASRVEEYLIGCCRKTGTEGLPEPESAVDALLYQLAGDIRQAIDEICEEISVTSKVAAIKPVTGYPLSISVEKKDGQAEASVTISGKNIFPKFAETKTYANGSSVTLNDDGSVTVHKVAGASVQQSSQIYLPAGTYVLSNGLDAGSPDVLVQIKESSTASNPQVVYTQAEDGFVPIHFYSSVANEFESFTVYPQLEVGSVASSYEEHESKTFSADDAIVVPAFKGTNTIITNGESFTVTGREAPNR